MLLLATCFRFLSESDGLVNNLQMTLLRDLVDLVMDSTWAASFVNTIPGQGEILVQKELTATSIKAWLSSGYAAGKRKHMRSGRLSAAS